MVELAGFWSGKRVLVTGHTGFMGGWLALWLHRLGAEVAGYALAPPTEPSLFALTGLARRLARHVTGDVRDLETLFRTVAECRPEVVFHLAAQPLVRQSYREPVETFQANLMGTVNLLEAVRRSAGVRALVNVTSDKSYENREQSRGYREDDPMGGHDPYSASKGCAELAAAAYRRSFFDASGTGIATARSGNVIGGGDWATDRLVPDILRACEAGRPIRLRAPDAVRPWQHVLEPVYGYLLLAMRLCDEPAAFAEAWNFGPDPADGRSVGWVAERLLELLGAPEAWQRDDGDNPHEAHLLTLDSAKARARLGWAPRWSIERALAATVEWHRALADGGDVFEVSNRQIDTYMNGDARS